MYWTYEGFEELKLNTKFEYKNGGYIEPKEKTGV